MNKEKERQKETPKESAEADPMGQVREKSGGVLQYIPGGENPADPGFHK